MERERNMYSKLLSKTSVLLIVSMALSMLLPIASYAASVMYFIYRPATSYSDAELSGYIYTKDPDAVAVSGTINGTVAEITYSRKFANAVYDDNNTPYYALDYSFRTDTAPSALTVTQGGAVHQLPAMPYPNYPGYYSYRSDAVEHLHYTYRMPGQNRMSTVTGATYLASGSEIASFKPSRITSANAIEIALPYNGDANATFNLDELKETDRDFEIIDQTVAASVYYSGVDVNSRGVLSFILDTQLQQDHEYLVKLSPTSSGKEIFLPPNGTYTASVSVGEWQGSFPNGYLRDENIVFFRNLTLGQSGGNPPVNGPGGNPSPGTPSGGTGGPSKPDRVIVNEESLRSGGKERAAVEIADGAKQVLLPVRAAEIVGDRKLEVSNSRMSLAVPADVLRELQKLVPADKLTGAHISFAFDTLPQDNADRLLTRAGGRANAKLKAAGDVYEFKLAAVAADGTEYPLSAFGEPVTLRLKVSGDANPALLGMYYLADDGTLEYVGGKLSGGEMIADVTHFSTYAVLEYDKPFDDVPNRHWASAAIRELSAKHVINGVDAARFAPDKEVTRAEFASMLARSLNLKAERAAAFGDVDPGSVHAAAIAAANEAGIVNGRSGSAFAPSDRITREEMAAMVVRAYAYRSGSKLEAAAHAAYRDLDMASVWAKPSIDSATGLGLLQGKSGQLFGPKQLTTRAEAAQVIVRLLKK